MSAAPSRAKEHTPDEWERIKRRFCDLYHKQKKTLAEVRQTLKDEDNFDATERQYKRKIKLWNLRKNANVGDYSHIDQLMQSPSTVPLGDVFMSQGIPITNNKIRRYMKHKGQKAPATTESHKSPPTDRTKDPSAKDGEAVHIRSPSTADETDSEPDKGRSSSKLMELLRQLSQLEGQVAQLKLQIQEEETARLSKLPHEVDIRASQQSEEPQQATAAVAAPAAPAKPAAPAPPAPAPAPAPAPEILAVREANAKKEWRTVTIRDLQLQPYRREPNPFEEAFKAAVKPGRPAANAFALSFFDNSNDDDDGFFSLLGFPRGDSDDTQPLAAPSDPKTKRTNILARQFRALHPESMFAVPAAGGNKLGDVLDGAFTLDLEPFLAGWTHPIPMSTSMPLRTGFTPGHSIMLPGPFL